MRKVWVLGVVVAGIMVVFWFMAARSQPPVDEEAPPDSVEANDVVDKELDAQGPVQLEFRDLRGNVTIKTGKPGIVLVTAVKRASGADSEAARRELESVATEIKTAPGKLILTTKIDTGRWPFTRSAAGKHVDYQLIVQEGTGATVTNAVGNVRITGLNQGVSVTGRKANVTLSNITGGITVHVDEGQIRVDGGGGGLDLMTRSGTIVAGKLGGKTLTVAGNENITLQDAEINGDVKVQGQTGDIKILRVHGKAITSDVAKGETDIEETTADGLMTATAKEGGLYFTRTNAGTLKASTGSGKIGLSETQGDMELSTKNGGLSLWRATAKSLRGEATGDIYFSGLFSPLGQHALQTTSGNISVYVSKESSLKLDATSTDGITIDPMITVNNSQGDDKHLRGAINDGLAPLSLSTKQGAIKILTGEPRFFP